MNTVMNPFLYRRLLARFDEVRVTRAGEKRIAIRNERRTDVKHWGEQYLVACPFCRAPGKLAISYLYGQADDTGRPATYLVSCFVRGCLRQPANREALAKRLGVGDGLLEQARLRDEPNRPAAPTVKLPRHLTPLEDLRYGHPARQFLSDRGIDPDVASRVYGLTYCDESDDTLAQDRLIVPVYSGDKLETWQSFSIRGTQADDPQPRYFSAKGIATSHLIYNLGRAARYETAVIVAEPMYVWRFGPMAVSPLRFEALSDRQRRRLLASFRKKTIVILMTERELERNADFVRKMTNRMPGRFAAIQMPRRQPGAHEVREYLRGLVTRNAAEKGVRICFAKCQQH